MNSCSRIFEDNVKPSIPSPYIIWIQVLMCNWIHMLGDVFGMIAIPKRSIPLTMLELGRKHNVGIVLSQWIHM
jgi:hypothetical protein